MLVAAWCIIEFSLVASGEGEATKVIAADVAVAEGSAVVRGGVVER